MYMEIVAEIFTIIKADFTDCYKFLSIIRILHTKDGNFSAIMVTAYRDFFFNLKYFNYFRRNYSKYSFCCKQIDNTAVWKKGYILSSNK